MYEAVIFDHDGTLVNSEQRHYQIWRGILDQFGHHFPEEVYITDYAGVPTLQNAEMLIRDYNLPLSADELCALKQTAVDDGLSQEGFPQMPGASEALEHCHSAGLAVAIASGARRFEIEHSRRTHQYDRFVNVYVCFEDVEHSKPAPDAYLLAASRLGMAPDKCIAVEDSYSGVTSAKAAGLYCIAIANDYSRSQDLSAADFSANSLAQACAQITALSSR